MDLSDCDRGDFSCRRAVGSSSFVRPPSIKCKFKKRLFPFNSVLRTRHIIADFVIQSGCIIPRSSTARYFVNFDNDKCSYWPRHRIRRHPVHLPQGRVIWVCILGIFLCYHDDVIKWKRFPSYCPFVKGIHRSTVDSPHNSQWRGVLMFSLIYAWKNKKKTAEQTIETPVIWDTIALILILTSL